ncbi:MAG: RagB/SusD family nutrient uptake outer membrane protein [Bacteroidales bacterium]
MLNIKNIFFASAMTAMLSSCGSDFLELDPHQNVGAPVAINKVEDISTALNGVYYWMGHHAFCGRNLTAATEMGADNVFHSDKTTHLMSLYNYSYQPTTGDLKLIWEAGGKVIDHSARIIKASHKLLANAGSKSDSLTIYQGLSQAYALRGFGTFALTNLFCLPYDGTNDEEQGMVLVHEPVELFESIGRSNLGETYEYIIGQFESAIEAAELSGKKASLFYLNAQAAEALLARVYLYKGDFANAKKHALNAIKKHSGKIVTTENAYNEMFDKISGSPEDIFVIAKSSNDYLSANSINTLYNTYGLGISNELAAMYASTDIRHSKMTGAHDDGSYKGGKYAETITNVPVVRLPEMYLIVAECEAEAGNAKAAAEALFEVAKRNVAIEDADDLPADIDVLKSFIADERRRELFQEGHRLLDARRRKETISVGGGTNRLIDGMFQYPIPNAEINASGIVQNTNWSDFMPVKAQ